MALDDKQASENPIHKVKTILVVDDDAEIGRFLVAAFAMEPHYQALYAIDAVQALEMVKTVIPDLFLLDYQLPGINGLELADRFLAAPTLAAIPVLLMSATLPKKDLQKRHITYIEKPFELGELFLVIEQLLIP